VYVHAGGGGGGCGLFAAACDTVNTRPAIVIVPVRAAPVFAATPNVTLPFPRSLEPDNTVIHDALLAAVQSQLSGADTAIGPPVPPAALKL
jgi:hypothetical protein